MTELPPSPEASAAPESAPVNTASSNTAPEISGELVPRHSASIGELPPGLEPALAHVLDVSGERPEWSISCPWMAIDDDDEIDVFDIPCGVVAACSQCSEETMAGFGPDQQYYAHGYLHVVGSDGAGYVEVQQACALSLPFAEEYASRHSWIDDFVTAYGPGLYMVRPGVIAGGDLIGVDPVRVVA